MSVLGIVPARGGSKSIRKKNIVDLGGKPLISYTLEALRRSELVTDHLVSTDDMEIAEVARQYGGNVPELRPAHLATDKTNIIDVLLDLMERVNHKYEYLLLLQPTAPCRTAGDIDNSIRLAYEYRTNSVVGFMKAGIYHPWYMYYRKGDGVAQVVPTEPGKPRQKFPEVLWRNGAIYLVKVDYFLKYKQFVTDDSVPYVMPPERSVNIDSPEDLELAKFYLERSYASVNS